MATKVNIEALRASAGKLDVDKRLSYGPRQGTTNMIDEHAKALQLNWQITNGSAALQTIVVSSFFDGYANDSIFGSITELLETVKADAVLSDGVLRGGSGAVADLTATSTDSNRDLHQFLRYIGQNPTRVVGISAVSRNATTGAGESSNYDLKLRTVWPSPFEVPVEKELNLRPLVQTGPNFTQERLNVNFVEKAFPVILSNEHFFCFQIQPNTTLTLTVYVGAQDSKSQRFWRDIKGADEVVRPMMLNM